LGESKADWSLGWADLVSASHDDGLWESPFTILLAERTGHKRYLSLIDGRGRYLSGEFLLSAIASAQKAFRRTHRAAVSGVQDKLQGDNE
jgi:hypothetical protein